MKRLGRRNGSQWVACANACLFLPERYQQELRQKLEVRNHATLRLEKEAKTSGELSSQTIFRQSFSRIPKPGQSFRRLLATCLAGRQASLFASFLAKKEEDKHGAKL